MPTGSRLPDSDRKVAAPMTNDIPKLRETERQPSFGRREVVAGCLALGGAALAASFPANSWTGVQGQAKSGGLHSPFRVSVINDEISQDFGRACEVASREFGMDWIELRGMWSKNIVNLDVREIAEAQRILRKYELSPTLPARFSSATGRVRRDQSSARPKIFTLVSPSISRMRCWSATATVLQ